VLSYDHCMHALHSFVGRVVSNFDSNLEGGSASASSSTIKIVFQYRFCLSVLMAPSDVVLETFLDFLSHSLFPTWHSLSILNQTLHLKLIMYLLYDLGSGR
jgi:hypothetical protein